MEAELYEPPSYMDYKISEEYTEALKIAYSQPSSEKMWQLLKEAHIMGDPRASYAIASSYLHTRPPIINRKNYKRAIEYLEPALNAHIPLAFYNYAICLEMGHGIKQNEDEAFNYYILAMQSGCKDAVEDIARCYKYGIGIKKHPQIFELWAAKLTS